MADVGQNFHQLCTEMRKDMENIKQAHGEFQQHMKVVTSKLDSDLEAHRSEMKKDMEWLHHELVSNLRGQSFSMGQVPKSGL